MEKNIILFVEEFKNAKGKKSYSAELRKISTMNKIFPENKDKLNKINKFDCTKAHNIIIDNKYGEDITQLIDKGVEIYKLNGYVEGLILKCNDKLFSIVSWLVEPKS